MVEELTDRLYLIQHSSDYFAAGKIKADSCQVLVGIHAHEILSLFFDMQGNFLKIKGTYFSQNRHDLSVYLINELGALPCTIRVKKFSVPDREIEIKDIPDYLQEFVDDPTLFGHDRREYLSKYLKSWQERGDYVLIWDEEYELSREGEIIST